MGTLSEPAVGGSARRGCWRIRGWSKWSHISADQRSSLQGSRQTRPNLRMSLMFVARETANAAVFREEDTQGAPLATHMRYAALSGGG